MISFFPCLSNLVMPLYKASLSFGFKLNPGIISSFLLIWPFKSVSHCSWFSILCCCSCFCCSTYFSFWCFWTSTNEDNASSASSKRTPVSSYRWIFLFTLSSDHPDLSNRSLTTFFCRFTFFSNASTLMDSYTCSWLCIFNKLERGTPAS